MESLPTHDPDPGGQSEIDMSESDPFQEVNTGRKRTKSDMSRSSEEEISPEKRYRMELLKSNLIFYIEARNANFGLVAKNKSIALKRELTCLIGINNSVKITGQSIRITCDNEAQKDRLMLVSTLLDHDVRITAPRSLQTSDSSKLATGEKNRENKQRGIIFGVPLDITNEEIKEEIGANWTKRLEKRDGEAKSITGTVIFEIKGEKLPEFVYVGYLKKYVKEYIPRPMRCYHCQAYGHQAKQCYAQEKCPKCSGNHSYDKCQKVDKPICPNCKGDHSAGHKLCPKFVQVQNTLELSVKQKMSYAQAAKKLKETEEQKKTHQHTSNTASVSKETVTPLGSTVKGRTETEPNTSNFTVLKRQSSIKNIETQADVSTPTHQEKSNESKNINQCSKEMKEMIDKLLQYISICITMLRKNDINDDLINQVLEQVEKVKQIISVDDQDKNCQLVQ